MESSEVFYLLGWDTGICFDANGISQWRRNRKSMLESGDYIYIHQVSQDVR